MERYEIIKKFELFKIANSLAIDFFPTQSESKEDRERLIDFKNVLRKQLSSRTKSVNAKKAQKLLDWMNPKRKWQWDDLESTNIIFEIEPSYEVYADLAVAGNIPILDEGSFLIYKFMLESEIYDRQTLVLLHKYYNIDLPERCEPFNAREVQVTDKSVNELRLEIIESNKNTNKKPKDGKSKAEANKSTKSKKAKSLDIEFFDSSYDDDRTEYDFDYSDEIIDDDLITLDDIDDEGDIGDMEDVLDFNPRDEDKERIDELISDDNEIIENKKMAAKAAAKPKASVNVKNSSSVDIKKDANNKNNAKTTKTPAKKTTTTKKTSSKTSATKPAKKTVAKKGAAATSKTSTKNNKGTTKSTKNANSIKNK